MSAPPYMKLYIADYLADTTHLTRDEHGAYLLLLMALWRAGGKLPNDPHKLAKLSKCSTPEWEEISPSVLEFFTVSGGALTQKRASIEIAKYEAVVSGAKSAAKRSVSQRANKNNELDPTNVATNVERTFNQPEPEPEPYPEVSKDTLIEASQAPPSTKAKRGLRRCPESWKPKPETHAKLIAEGYIVGDLERAMTRMRDHEFKTAKTDWDATFRNWVRQDADYRPTLRTSPNDQQRPDAKRAAREANLSRAFAGAEAASRFRSQL